MAKKILIIDDDKKLNQLMTDYLGDFGYQVITADEPLKGLDILSKNEIDLVILDIMLPGMNGFEVCKMIRRDSQVPVIMLTARGEVSDRIVGLEIGADDYMPKPFEPRELVARIETVLRRMGTDQRLGTCSPMQPGAGRRQSACSPMQPGAGRRQSACSPMQPGAVLPFFQKEVLIFGDLEINFTSRTVKEGGRFLDITTMEFEVLSLFVRSPGRAFDRDSIMESLKGFECQAFDRSIDVLISRLRQKLGDDPKHPRYIKTIWGMGYAFVGHDESAK